MILVWISDYSEGCRRVIFNFVFLFDLLVSWNSTQELSPPPHFFVRLYHYRFLDSCFTCRLMTRVSVCVCTCSVTQSCHTLCDSVDCSPPSSSVHGIFQAGVLKQVAISPVRESSQPRDWTCVSCMGRQILIFTTEPPGKPHLWFIYYYHHLFWCSNCPRFCQWYGPSGCLLCPSDSSSSFFGRCLLALEVVPRSSCIFFAMVPVIFSGALIDWLINSFFQQIFIEWLLLYVLGTFLTSYKVVSLNVSNMLLLEN